MKYLTHAIIILLVSMIGFSNLYAQDIDQKRMQRDLNIMESVLEEIFKEGWKTNNQSLRIRGFNNTGDIQGIHLDKYGVIFTIPFEQSIFFIFQNSNEGEISAPKRGNNTKITKDEIISRISGFLMDYGSTIGQLKADDKVTVIYATNSGTDGSFLRVLSRDNSKAITKESLPTISITVRYSDLQAYRNGSLSKDALQEKLQISTNNEGEPNFRDLKIMADIIKTSFEESEMGSFSVDGKVNNIHLNDLGALFMMEASYINSPFNELISFRKALAGNISIDSLKMESSEQNSGKLSERMKKLKRQKEESFQNFKTLLKETIVDYGRTLKSVESSEQIFVSVSISNPAGDLPERVDLRIKKSVLKAVDTGDISREQAMQQITVQEY